MYHDYFDFTTFTTSTFKLLLNDQLDLLFSFLHFIWAIYVVMRSCYFCAEANKKHIVLSIALTVFTSEFLIELLNINYSSFNNLTSIISKIVFKMVIISILIYMADISEDVYDIFHKYFSYLFSFLHGILQFRIFIIVTKKSNYVIGAIFALSDTITELLTRKLVRGRSGNPLTGENSIIRTSLIIISFMAFEPLYKKKYYKQMVVLSSFSLGIINLIFAFL